MSMYNMLFGMNPLASIALAALSREPDDFGRFRDAWIDLEEEQIVVYTRNGAGNREHYAIEDGDEEGEACGCTGCVMQYRIPQMPHYLRDEDDEYDCTYAWIYFSFPPEIADQLRALQQAAKESGHENPVTLGTRMHEVLDALRKMPPPGDGD